MRIGLTVSDLDAAAATCADGDAVRSDSDRVGDRVLVVTDPDGHLIELTDR